MNYRATYFPDLEIPAYLNHAAIAPLNRRARDAMVALAEHYAREGAGAWPAGNQARERVRGRLAELISVAPADIGLVSNTSHGLGVVALEFPWRSGDRLVLFEAEFPGNIIPWLNAARRFDLEVLWLTLDDLLEESDTFHRVMATEPRLLAISWVQFQTGRAVSLKRLSALRERYGVKICVDAIQGLGPLTADLSETPIDYFVSGGHKWLLATEGAGFVYIHPERMAELVPTIGSWLSLEDPVRFLFDGAGLMDYGRPHRVEPSRYEMGTMNAPGFAALDESVGLLLEVGPAEVSRLILENATYCRRGLADLGIETAGDDAGIVSFPLPPEHLPKAVSLLAENGVRVASPDGHLRVSAHFYNTTEDLDRFLQVLETRVADWFRA